MESKSIMEVKYVLISWIRKLKYRLILTRTVIFWFLVIYILMVILSSKVGKGSGTMNKL